MRTSHDDWIDEVVDPVSPLLQGIRDLRMHMEETQERVRLDALVTRRLKKLKGDDKKRD